MVGGGVVAVGTDGVVGVVGVVGVGGVVGVEDVVGVGGVVGVEDVVGVVVGIGMVASIVGIARVDERVDGSVARLEWAKKRVGKSVVKHNRQICENLPLQTCLMAGYGACSRTRTPEVTVIASLHPALNVFAYYTVQRGGRGIRRNNPRAAPSLPPILTVVEKRHRVVAVFWSGDGAVAPQALVLGGGALYVPRASHDAAFFGVFANEEASALGFYLATPAEANRLRDTGIDLPDGFYLAEGT